MVILMCGVDMHTLLHSSSAAMAAPTTCLTLAARNCLLLSISSSSLPTRTVTLVFAAVRLVQMSLVWVVVVSVTTLARVGVWVLS